MGKFIACAIFVLFVNFSNAVFDMPKCRTWANQECMEALATPDRKVAHDNYVKKLNQIMTTCKNGADACITKNLNSSNAELNSMMHEYHVFQIDVQKGLDAILRNEPSKPICDGAANYCSTCQQLWDFCPKP